ncbi:hypothetical protein [Arcobacter sp. FWKO B]|uniref:hypothetical protein n=1 Tax=Arcobacter sp. FWKO B TaxID=2593672 RepID=UPI0018A4FEFA|nr:hypothetical protein [Arcobacter sp. FWKO B]QOG12321.1 hypothetical protein FWKOB_06255 [Arcobacter sp. FWKO B]
MKTLLLSIITLFILTGCSVKYDQVAIDNENKIEIIKEDTKTKQKIQSLTQMIQDLSPTIDKNEAYLLAKNSVYYSMHLANSYNLVKPPSFQNFLVNQNLRDRGLCHQWASDILEYIRKDNYQTLSIYKVVANQGSYLYEHHALSITPKNKPFDEGIILDAWRKSGDLFFVLAREDKEYFWKLIKKVH